MQSREEKNSLYYIRHIYFVNPLHMLEHEIGRLEKPRKMIFLTAFGSKLGQEFRQIYLSVSGGKWVKIRIGPVVSPYENRPEHQTPTLTPLSRIPTIFMLSNSRLKRPVANALEKAGLSSRAGPPEVIGSHPARSAFDCRIGA